MALEPLLNGNGQHRPPVFLPFAASDEGMLAG
jgi:hypothetical protein